MRVLAGVALVLGVILLASRMYVTAAAALLVTAVLFEIGGHS